MSASINLREADYFLDMIRGFEARYKKSSSQLLVEFHSGCLDQENDDFGTWVFLCSAFEQRAAPRSQEDVA